MSEVLMPRMLTAENGAKAALIGEFCVKVKVECPNCCGGGIVDDGEHGEEDCVLCDEGYIDQDISIPWPTIKKIYAAAVNHFHPGEEE